MREHVAVGWLGQCWWWRTQVEGSVAHGPGHSHDKRGVAGGCNEWQNPHHLQASVTLLCGNAASVGHVAVRRPSLKMGSRPFCS